ncbi:hypothetical protein BH09MYX1_BH09MYX1_14260 [soil metagenome]
MTKRDQLGLFASQLQAVITERDRELAKTLPKFLRFGTSSWTFPGWGGVLYAGKPSAEELVRDGLKAYASHPLFRTVGIDRSYYGPLTDADLGEYARALGGVDFLAVSKVWDELTTVVFPHHPRFGDRAGRRNPDFLSPERFLDEVLAPYTRSFAQYTGPFVFEIPPVPEGALPSDRAIPDAIERLLVRLPSTFRYSFELRNRELLTRRYFDVLRAHRAAHCFNMWTAMPPVGRQLELPGSITTDFAVCRLMLPPATRYDAMKKAFAPFDKIVRVEPDMRSDVVRLEEACAKLEVQGLFVLVNNKAEGSSPLTVKALAEAIVRARDPAEA